MKTDEIKGNNILLLGYGRENRSVHRFLLKNYPGITIAIADKNPVTPIQKVPRVYTGENYLQSLTLTPGMKDVPSSGIGLAINSPFSTVIRSPGIPIGLPEIQQYIQYGGHITTATNIFFSLCPGVTIGITGTKGKSTTSSLIAHILSDSRNRGALIPGISRGPKPDVWLVGNIGEPMLDHLDNATDKTMFVIELSSHMLEDIRYSPHIAVIHNIVPEHMDYYKNFNQYATAKGNIVKFQKAHDYIIFNSANTLILSLINTGKGKRIPFSTDEKTVIPIPFSEMQLRGNMENVCAAIAVAALMKVPAETIKKSLTTFQPLAHRLEYVGEFKGITFYNDSLATIPEATIHALESLGENVTTLMAGGFDRGLDYTRLGQFLAKRKKLHTLILFPDTGERIWEALRAAVGNTHIRRFDVTTMGEAVRLAYENTPPGTICLLSPASASFNLFTDYADRGNQFKDIVQKIKSSVG